MIFSLQLSTAEEQNEWFMDSLCAAFRVQCLSRSNTLKNTNMGLLSDPNRRRALINLLTRLNTPIWSVHSHVEIDTVDKCLTTSRQCAILFQLSIISGMSRAHPKLCGSCVCLFVVLFASWQVWPGSWVWPSSRSPCEPTCQKMQWAPPWQRNAFLQGSEPWPQAGSLQLIKRKRGEGRLENS